jgi:parallel beta-helix repeat protein
MLMLGLVATVDAQTLPPCGVVVENTTLQGDCEGPLVVANSDLNVNLGGHTITCNGDTSRDGINITNQRNVHVENGRVTACGTGIDIQGGGSHRLNNLTVFANVGAPAGPGPVDPASFPLGDAIRLAMSHDNELRNVDTFDNTSCGARLVGSSRNDIRWLAGTNQSCAAAMTFEANFNTVTSSVGNDNRDAGFLVYLSNNNTLRANEARRNREGIGLFTGATNNVVQANVLTENQVLGGIRVSPGATSNVLQANRAFDNVPVDMNELNPGCDANIWKANQFGTASQPCVQ